MSTLRPGAFFSILRHVFLLSHNLFREKLVILSTDLDKSLKEVAALNHNRAALTITFHGLRLCTEPTDASRSYDRLIALFVHPISVYVFSFDLILLILILIFVWRFFFFSNDFCLFYALSDKSFIRRTCYFHWFRPFDSSFFLLIARYRRLFIALCVCLFIWFCSFDFLSF